MEKEEIWLYQCNLQYSRLEKTYVGTYGNGCLSLIIKQMKSHTPHGQQQRLSDQQYLQYCSRTKRESVFRNRKRTVFLQPERTDLYQLDTGTGITRSKLQSDCRNTYTRNGQLILEATKVSSFCPTVWNCPQAFPATWYSLTWTSCIIRCTRWKRILLDKNFDETNFIQLK